MEKTTLWKIIKKMPKGTLLHAHMDAMVDFDYLFDLLLKTPGMQIHCDRSLDTPEALEAAPIRFRYRKIDGGMYPVCGRSLDLVLELTLLQKMAL